MKPTKRSVAMLLTAALLWGALPFAGALIFADPSAKTPDMPPKASSDLHLISQTMFLIETMPEPAQLPDPQPLGELLTPCGYTEDELARGLLYELTPYAAEFLAAERDTGINAVFLAAVAALESGWGTSRLADTKHNLFGWSAKDGYRAFASAGDCIAYVAEKLKTNYLTEGGCYFYGYTVEAVNRRYNGSDHWQSSVRSLSKQIEERIAQA